LYGAITLIAFIWNRASYWLLGGESRGIRAQLLQSVYGYYRLAAQSRDSLGHFVRPYSAPSNWSVKRRLEYVRWARDVALGLRGINQKLEEQCDNAAAAAERSFKPAI
jgi:hypothetical protein